MKTLKRIGETILILLAGCITLGITQRLLH